MKDYKSLLIFFIPYFTVCGSLYHIAFWSTFKINGLSYIGTSDIIKSAVVPIISFFLLFALGKFISEIVFSSEKILPSGGGRNTNLGKRLNSGIGIKLNLLLWIFLVFYLYFKNNVNIWYSWAIITGIAPSIFLDRIGFLSEQITNWTSRKTIIWTIVYIPIFSFASGKYESQLIHKNIEYKYTTKTKQNATKDGYQTDTLKFIAKTEKEVFFTNLNNSTIYILQVENTDTLSLKQKD